MSSPAAHAVCWSAKWGLVASPDAPSGTIHRDRSQSARSNTYRATDAVVTPKPYPAGCAAANTVSHSPPISTGGGLSRAAQSASREESEEHTSELQSHLNLVCRLLLAKKKIT